MEYRPGKDPRTPSERQAAYDEAFRQLHRQPEPTHTRRQRDQDGHSGRSDQGRLPSVDAGRHRRRHRTNEERGRPTQETRHVQHPYPIEEQVPRQQAARQHSRARREGDSRSRHGARHHQRSHAIEDQGHIQKSAPRQPSNTARDGNSRSNEELEDEELADTIVGLGDIIPAQRPNYTLKDGRGHNSVHMSDVLRSGSQRTNGSRQTADRDTKWSDFLNLDPPVSPLTPTLPSLPEAVRTPHHGAPVPVCRMCERNPSSMDPRFSNSGYHLCTQCTKKAFKEPESPVSPVSPLTPARTSEGRIRAFHFSDSSRGRDSSRTSRNSGRSNARNITGHAPTSVTHVRQNTIRRVIQDPEIERQRALRAQRAQAEQDFNPWTSTAPLPQQNLSSGLNPALHEVESRPNRREVTYSTIIDARSQPVPAQPMPPVPKTLRQARPRDLSPDRQHLRHKTSSVYSVASDALPPSILPPVGMGSHRESQMIAPGILPPSSIVPSIAEHPYDSCEEDKAYTLPPPLPPREAMQESSSRLFPRRQAAPAEVEMMPNHHRNTTRKPRASQSSSHAQVPKQKRRQPAEGLRVQPQTSPSPSVWTACWDGYDEETRREAGRSSVFPVPRMPPIPASPAVVDQGRGRESQVRNTGFYKGFDDLYDAYL